MWWLDRVFPCFHLREGVITTNLRRDPNPNPGLSPHLNLGPRPNSNPNPNLKSTGIIPSYFHAISLHGWRHVFHCVLLLGIGYVHHRGLDGSCECSERRTDERRLREHDQFFRFAACDRIDLSSDQRLNSPTFPTLIGLPRSKLDSNRTRTIPEPHP